MTEYASLHGSELPFEDGNGAWRARVNNAIVAEAWNVGMFEGRRVEETRGDVLKLLCLMHARTQNKKQGLVVSGATNLLSATSFDDGGEVMVLIVVEMFTLSNLYVWC